MIVSLLPDDRSRLWRERQEILRALLLVNHQIATLARRLGITTREAAQLAKHHQ